MAAAKVLTLSEAVEHLLDDSARLVAIGGMHMHNNPMAVIREAVRQRRKIGRLLTSPSGSIGADLLVGAGLVEEVATAYVGFEHLGLAPCFRRKVESGAVRVVELDEAAISHGLYAGAAGVPFVPLPLGLELADLSKVNQESYRMVEDPFGGARHLAVAAIRPDLAILHATEADSDGNVAFKGCTFTDRLMALAARHVLIQVERLVGSEQISAYASGSTLPAFLVDAVVVSPGGCHPTSSHGEYEYDQGDLARYLELAATEEGLGIYLSDPLDGSEQGYWANVNVEHLFPEFAANPRQSVA